MLRIKNNNWSLTSAEVFWREIAPCDHVMQIYDDDSTLLNTLLDYVVDGLAIGDTVVLIATQDHLTELEESLLNTVPNFTGVIRSNRYISLEAQECLDRFMVNGWPDETLFNEFLSGLFKHVKKNGTKIRAFGEMVALLWEQGLYAATVRLEYLWCDFCKKESFCLFCAYPESSFKVSKSVSLETICATHSKLIRNPKNDTKKLAYTVPDFL